jgi:hypothetical protein
MHPPSTGTVRPARRILPSRRSAIPPRGGPSLPVHGAGTKAGWKLGSTLPSARRREMGILPSERHPTRILPSGCTVSPQHVIPLPRKLEQVRCVSAIRPDTADPSVGGQNQVAVRRHRRAAFERRPAKAYCGGDREGCRLARRNNPGGNEGSGWPSGSRRTNPSPMSTSFPSGWTNTSSTLFHTLARSAATCSRIEAPEVRLAHQAAHRVPGEQDG